MKKKCDPYTIIGMRWNSNFKIGFTYGPTTCTACTEEDPFELKRL
jgi:hypothetical protein